MFVHNLRVFLALLRRDMQLIYHNLKDEVLNALLFVIIEVLVVGQWLPMIGLSPELIGPQFIGSFMLILFTRIFQQAFTWTFALRFNRFVDYHCTLPISASWLLAEYAVVGIINAVVITLPIFVFGLMLLPSTVMLNHMNIIGFAITYFLSLIFLCTFFLSFSFWFSFEWFQANVWPRILTPLLSLGANFFVWSRIYTFSPLIAYAFLWNPCTFIAEGMRVTLLPPNDYLPMYVCIPMLTLFAVLGSLSLYFSFYKRLDPV